MARVGLPDFLAKCACGNLLVNEPGGSYWTRYAPYLAEAGKMDLPDQTCPGCGGISTVPMGNFFYPGQLLKQQKYLEQQVFA